MGAGRFEACMTVSHHAHALHVPVELTDVHIKVGSAVFLSEAVDSVAELCRLRGARAMGGREETAMAATQLGQQRDLLHQTSTVADTVVWETVQAPVVTQVLWELPVAREAAGQDEDGIPSPTPTPAQNHRIGATADDADALLGQDVGAGDVFAGPASLVALQLHHQLLGDIEEDAASLALLLQPVVGVGLLVHGGAVQAVQVEVLAEVLHVFPDHPLELLALRHIQLDHLWDGEETERMSVALSDLLIRTPLTSSIT